MTSLVHGLIAGGAAAHLYQWTKTQTATADAWMPVALQVNHLLLLTAETMAVAGLPLKLFGQGMRAACILAPAAVGASLYQKPIMPLSPERLGQFNSAYRAGVIATSVASGLFGNPVFAIASLGMLATDLITNEEVKAVSVKVNKLMGVLAFVGYSAQIMASKAALATVAKVSAVAVGSKFLFVDFLSKLEPLNTDSNTVSQDTDSDSCCCHDSDSSSSSVDDSGTGVSLSASTIGETLCRSSVW